MKSLRELRNGLVFAQREVAEELGISVEHYNQLERGRHMPRPMLIRELAELFEVDAAELRVHLLERTQEVAKPPAGTQGERP
jgi:transcriptional regulator with XRE-family HTH domain